MKVRKLAVALALAGGLSSGLAHAMGMGEGQILTRLNEPLRAEIELTRPGDVSMDQIKIGLASQEEFERFGIRRMGILSQLDFEITRDADNKLIVEVTTENPVREPFVKMLVELTWPNGRLMREYSFLVDPPKRSSGPEAAGPEGGGETGQTRASPPEPAERGSATEAAQTGSQPSQSDEYGPTSANDTLWSIAGRVNAPEGASRQQVMLALKDANPGAFVNDNINQLRKGQVLRFPSEQKIRSRSTQEAVREVMAQNEAYRSRRGDAASDAVVQDSPSDSTNQAAGSGAAGGGGSSDDELRILVADNESGNGEGDTAGMGDGEGDEALSAALEELDRAKRDRDELKSRLGDLEEQIDTMAQLIELKDDQLAELQQRLAEADEDAEIPEDLQANEEAAGDDEAASTDGTDTDETDEESERADPAAATGDNGPDPESGEAPEPETDDAGGGDSDTDRGEPSTGTGGDGAESGAEGGSEDQTETSAADTGAAADPDESSREQTGMAEAPTTVGGFFDRLVKEPMYQIGAGVLGILLLLVLWALARRNAAREKAFYDQVRDVSGDEEAHDVLDLEPEAEAPGGSENAGEETDSRAPESSDDVIADADVYMAYGRMDQASQHLEQAISKEPSRADLRLKLLEVYANTGDSDTFEKQYRELSALGDDKAIEKADALREQLGDAGEDLSIDDLAEQLKTGPGAESEATGADVENDDSFDFSALDEADELLSDDESSGESTSAETDEALEFEEDFGFDDEEPQQGSSESEGIDFEFSETESAPQPADEDVEDLGFSLDDLELEEPAVEAPAEQETSGESALDLELDEDSAIPDTGEFEDASDDEIPVADVGNGEGESGQPLAEEEPEPLTEINESIEREEAPSAAESEAEADTGSESFDESFLDELDAELDKVTEAESGSEGADTSTTEAPAEPEAAQEGETSGEELSDLELDVSEDDLGLMDELSGEESGETTEQASESSNQGEEGLLDTDLGDNSAEETLSDEEKAALEGTGPAQEESASGESGEDDEFDFLEGTDEAGTKLDLARAYVEMGDAEGARDILEEVSKEGSEQQQQEAQRLLAEL
ncbi:pilus assembly protein FimV [Halospina denitrificans]|uniref:Pilus assembly protein FimV n=1 Tax=Halospina denitrificans TaxID=332522 RepID=A0A4R7JT98_9GAMM|nr:FimV/HubP family polar landmark protein [Halospina denitrificans]TDT41542.1 pilus assembly protein FimV [Halospina denitrificans]